MTPVCMNRTAGRGVRCESCGRLVHLTAQPVTWTNLRGRWVVSAWGPPAGECCGVTYVAPGTPETDIVVRPDVVDEWDPEITQVTR